MNAISFDIETIPNEALIPLLPEPEVKLGNIKDAAKIRDKIKAEKEKAIEKMGINPETGMICSFSVYGFIDGNEVFDNYVIKEISYTEEIELIKKVFEYVCIDTISKTIVTHNGMNFDLPYLYKRAMINKVELPCTHGCTVPKLSHWLKKYTYHPHCDTMQIWNNWSHDTKGSSLDYLGTLLCGSGKTNRDYTKYLAYIKEGKQEIIAADNNCDAMLTYRLYNKMYEYLF